MNLSLMLLRCSQGDGEAERLPDGELRSEGVLHPRRDGQPGGSFSGRQEELQQPRTPSLRLAQLGCPAQGAVGHPAANAGAHAVRGGDYRQAGRHHSESHQTDPLKVSTALWASLTA